MSIKKFNKNYSSAALPKRVSTSDDKKSLVAGGEVKLVMLAKVNAEGKILQKPEEILAFPLNPSSYEDSKTANWVQHNVPGQSDPVMQWTSSGSRTVTFDALITLDISNADFYYNFGKTEEDVATRFSRLATDLFNAQKLNKVYKSERTAASLEITTILEYLRSLLYPSYKEQNGIRSLNSSPPLVVLYTGTTISPKSISETLTKDTPIWAVTDLRIKVTKMLPNMSPMEAIASITLVQYSKVSIDTNSFDI